VLGNGVDDACNGWADEVGVGTPIDEVAVRRYDGEVEAAMGLDLDVGSDADGNGWLVTSATGHAYAGGHVLADRIPLDGSWDTRIEPEGGSFQDFGEVSALANWPAPFLVNRYARGLRLYEAGVWTGDEEEQAWALFGIGIQDMRTAELTGDGWDDLLLSSTSLLVIGGPLPDTGELPVAYLEVTASPPTQNFAYQVGEPGDLDGDGVPELTAYGEEDAIGGRVWVVPGGLTGVVAIEDVGWRIDGEIPEGEAGYNIALGDVTGDGIADVLTGAILANDRAGVSYLYPGPITGDGLLADGVAQFDALYPLDLCGYEVEIVPDQDGDGQDEVVVACPFDPFFGPPIPGRIEIYAGSAAVGRIDAHAATAVYVGDMPGDHVGWCLDAEGDLNGDEVVDLAVGATGADYLAMDGGSVYILAGPLF
jgi:hypothetical protein